MSVSHVNSPLEILDRALCLEIDGEDFYRQAAQRTTDASGRQMFLDLADQEAQHQAMIRHQMESLKSSGHWQADERTAGASCDLSLSLFPQGEARHTATGPRANELEALWFALQKESESYELYRQGALQAKDPVARSLFQYLMNAERSHFDTLMTSYEGILREQYRST